MHFLFLAQAVVAAESTSFVEVRPILPKLQAACNWADIEGSWAYARARASEMQWQRKHGAAAAASAAPVATASAPAPRTRLGGVKEETASTGIGTLVNGDPRQNTAGFGKQPSTSQEIGKPEGIARVIVPSGEIAHDAERMDVDEEDDGNDEDEEEEDDDDGSQNVGGAEAISVGGKVTRMSSAAVRPIVRNARRRSAVIAEGNGDGNAATDCTDSNCHRLVEKRGPPEEGAGTAIAIQMGVAGAAGAAGTQVVWRPDPGVYCLCREADDGGVMVSCDGCEEWFHARW